MKTSFDLLCVLAFALPTNAQKAIDGKWESHFTGAQNQPIRVVFDFKSASDMVAGTVTSWRGSEQLHQVQIQNGKIQGNTVTFGIPYMLPFLYNRFGWRELATRVRNWGSPINSITGTLNDENISFSQHDWQGRTTEFQARKMR
jgi:hypothetical protein